MFYEQLIALCERDGIKPTPLIRSLGFSAGNIKRWKNGATVNSDILLAIAEHFEVSIDYLLTGKEKTPKATTIELPQSKLTENEEEILSLLNQLSERDQIKLIGKAEEIVKEMNQYQSNKM